MAGRACVGDGLDDERVAVNFPGNRGMGYIGKKGEQEECAGSSDEAYTSEEWELATFNRSYSLRSTRSCCDATARNFSPGPLIQLGWNRTV